MDTRTTDRPGFPALIERAEAARRETVPLVSENRENREQTRTSVYQVREIGRSLRPTPAVIPSS